MPQTCRKANVAEGCILLEVRKWSPHCVCECIAICVEVHMDACACSWVCVSMHIYMCMFEFVHVWVDICGHVFCMSLWMCTWVGRHVVYILSLHVYKCVHDAYECAHTRKCAYVRVYALCLCVCKYYVSMHALCFSESVSTQMCACMKITGQCQDLHHPLSTLVLETASLTEPRVHPMTRLAG